MSPTRLDLFLVRHGRTDWNDEGRLMGRTEVPLNRRGRAQAEEVARALGEFPITRILASPQRRAQETAEVISRAIGVRAGVEPLLAEVWLGERWLGKRFDETARDPEVARSLADPTYRSDSIESASAVQERMAELVERLREEGGCTAVVSHGDPLRLLLTYVLGLELAGYQRLHLGTGSVSVVRLGRRRGQLLALNWQGGGLRAAIPD